MILRLLRAIDPRLLLEQVLSLRDPPALRPALRAGRKRLREAAKQFERAGGLPIRCRICGSPVHDEREHG